VRFDLPIRPGPRPSTTPTNPHTQLDQQPADASISEELARQVFALEGVEERASIISVPGARALWLQDDLPAGPREAFIMSREFAHIHPSPDHSLHLALPPEVVPVAIERGWAELHPVAARGLIPRTAVMIYAPRDSEEVEVVGHLVATSWRFARGEQVIP
jgi:Family of unknown function (DUF5519)